MKYLITGGCGFLGSNIASAILKKNDELIIFDNLYRFGSMQNLEWLKSQGGFTFLQGDIRKAADVENAIKTHTPEVIYHLAGQVAMTTSIDDPRLDFEINELGSFNVLDSIRKYSQESIVVYSSTNKVYGDLEWTRYEETESLISHLTSPTVSRKQSCLTSIRRMGVPKVQPINICWISTAFLALKQLYSATLPCMGEDSLLPMIRVGSVGSANKR